ncbi:MAG: SH3 domain-containing protein [Gemmatimonadota bacterium]|nr:SH3 domain-containing protein [Gemmatimonadota bacterium]
MRRRTLWLSLPLCLCVSLIPACSSKTPSQEVVPIQTMDTLRASEPTVITRVDTIRVTDPALEARVARLDLELAEREGELKEMESRLAEARLEVVRTMAKLQTVATRAEAASAMAEAEIAVQGLKAVGGTELRGAVAESQQMLAQSGEEFGRQNHGGALYLATQAKNIATAGRARVAGVERAGRRQGEVLFAAPVRLEVTSRANLRDAPSTGARVVITLEKGAPLIAISHVGNWLRVTDGSGREGWIFQELVSRGGR